MYPCYIMVVDVQREFVVYQKKCHYHKGSVKYEDNIS